MSKIGNEFKEFILRGNVIDMAVGIVIGGAFKGIIDSLVADVIMPPIGLLIGGVDFAQLKIVLQQAAGDTPEVAINYGLLINAIISFLLIALAIFLVVKGINKMRTKFEKKQEVEEEVVVNELSVLTEILAELKKDNVNTIDPIDPTGSPRV